ncbi:MAG: cation:proton antiporter [Vulcanimicrobiota bacterium]
MHHNLDLLENLAAVLCVAFLGGYVARRLGAPTLAGYLVAGLAIGPFTPGFVGDIEDIRQLAELGVIFMMFGVGLHFSLGDLWEVRAVAVPGAIAQITIATGLTWLVTSMWDWSTSAGLVVGLALSIASTVVLLRGLTDNGLLNTIHGKVAVGWLVLEDLATVAILVVLPALALGTGNPVVAVVVALLKTAAFSAVILMVGRRLMPWILNGISQTRSRELFILAVMAVSVGTAMLAAELFGISLALGAFLAGLMIGESDVSHQVAAEALPFQEIFAVIFFVSVGMLVDPATLVENAWQVIVITALIIVGKAATTILLGLILPARPTTMLVVAAGLSQIGEFSFIVGTTGVSLSLITNEQYGLVLAGALLSIVINPFLFKLVKPTENFLRTIPWLWNGLTWRRVEEYGPVIPDMENHVVVVGAGRVGTFMVRVLDRLSLPILLVEQNEGPAKPFAEAGIPVLYGDASNSDLLTHAQLDKARSLVVTVPSQSAAELIVATARQIAPDLHVISRASTTAGIQRLSKNGARDVIHPELEGSLEIMRHTLLNLNHSPEQVQRYIDAVRRETYYSEILEGGEWLELSKLLTSVGRLGLYWVTVSPQSRMCGKTLGEIALRTQTGASVVALVRGTEVTSNPSPQEPIEAGNLVALIGDPEQLIAAEAALQEDSVDRGSLKPV